MSYRVSLSDNARSDVDGFLGWLTERSPRGAAAWADRFEEVFLSLQERPESRSKAPESELYDVDIHQIVFKTRRGRIYRALYVVRELDVTVIHVRGSGQDILSSDELRLPDDRA